jgi:hypothetical protein
LLSVVLAQNQYHLIKEKAVSFSEMSNGKVLWATQQVLAVVY